MSTKSTYLLTLLFLFSFTASTPKKINNICELFKEKEGWYDDAKESFEKWGIPIH
ncbi:MAG: hypothetical protein L3J59_14220, partial [Methylococcaceae bacterium]|nr:hypothetical protein [Methylococcaceae bacterium]